MRSSSSARFAKQCCALTDMHHRATCAQTLFSLLAASLSNSVAPATSVIRATSSGCCFWRISVAFASVGTRLRVAQLFLVMIYRMRVASDLMSQHLRIILRLTEALYAVPLIAPVCGARECCGAQNTQSCHAHVSVFPPSTPFHSCCDAHILRLFTLYNIIVHFTMYVWIVIHTSRCQCTHAHHYHSYYDLSSEHWRSYLVPVVAAAIHLVDKSLPGCERRSMTMNFFLQHVSCFEVSRAKLSTRINPISCASCF